MADDANRDQQAGANSAETQKVGSAPQANMLGTTSTGTLFKVGSEFDPKANVRFDNVQRFDGLQVQYKSSKTSMKTVNFKQDYVVLVRKKVYYAANAVNNTFGRTTGQIGEGNYLRTYKVDCFVSLNTNISTLGQPGGCSIVIKGAERVTCYEHDARRPGGTPSVMDMVNGVDYSGAAAIVNDSNNSLGVNPQLASDADILEGKVRKTAATAATNADSLWNRATKSCDGSAVTLNKTGAVGTAAIGNQDGSTTDVSLPADVPLTNSQKSDGSTVDDVSQRELTGFGSSSEKTPWKFAEKCDFQAMDEVWVFGKSNFERDESGDFKMNQIFFGYIDTVTHSTTAGKSPTPTITLAATDQLKLLGLSYVTQNPSMTMGISMNGSGFDIRFGNKDVKHMGTYEVYDPYAAMQATGGTSAASATSAQAADASKNTAYACFAYTNVFAGLPVSDIIHKLCDDAGVPPWYTNSRIEPIKFPPFTMNLKQASSDMLFQESTQTRLSVCVQAAQKLMLEFYADERGNIVFKCPNYALGVNSLTANNMNLSELKGGLLGKINLYDVTSSYWSPSIEVIDNVKLDATTKADVEASTGTDQGGDAGLVAKGYSKVAGSTAESTPTGDQVKGSDGVYSLTTSVEQRSTVTNAQREYLNAAAQAKVLQSTDGNVTAAFHKVDGVTELSGLASGVASLKSAGGNQTSTVIKVADGDTLYNLAANYLGSGERWHEIYDTNAHVFSALDAGPEELYKLVGQTLYIYYNTVTDDLDVLEAKAKASTSESTESSTPSSKAADAPANTGKVARAQYDNTLSNLTDALIPEIPQEYITGFSLVNTDKGIYNSYEVNVETDFGIFDKGGPITKISRVFADFPSMIRYGVRPSPKVINFPYLGNRENAHLLGFMLCAKSMADANSATLTMIEDSFIRVGDPIRFFAYDEYPGKPLNSNDVTSSLGQSGSSLSNMSRGGTSLAGGSWMSHATGEELLAAVGISLNKGGATPSARTTASAEVAGTTVEGTIPVGNALNLSTGALASGGSLYSGMSAASMSMTTDAQSIYYVEAISRSINPSDKSTMQLTLTSGRMMGKPSNIDHMLLLYKTFYDPNTGFCPDLTKINNYKSKYAGNTQSYTIKAEDTLLTIAKNLFGVNVSPVKAVQPPVDDDPATKYGEYAVVTLAASDPCHAAAKENGWTVWTSTITGKVYRTVANKSTVECDVKYYLYDSDNTKFVFKNETTGSIETFPAGQKTYEDHAKELINSCS